MEQPAPTSKELPRPPPPPKSPPPPSQHPPPYSDDITSVPCPAPSPSPDSGSSRIYTPGQSHLYVTTPFTRPRRSLHRRHVLLTVPILLIATYLLSRTISFPMSLPGFSMAPGCEHATATTDDNASALRLHPIPLATIPQETLQQKKRIIFVGDVHGELQHLHSLLEKVEYDSSPSSDIVVLLGDIISKGPDSPGVVDWARAQPEGSLYCVRGNHEHNVLTAAAELDKERKRKKKAPHGRMSPEEREAEKKLLEEVEKIKRKHGRKGEERARRLAKELTEEQKDWLASCPVMLQIPVYMEDGRKVKGKKNMEYLAVHAGLEAGVRLEDQDLKKVMNLRLTDKPVAMDVSDESDDDSDSDDSDNEDDSEDNEPSDDSATIERRRKHKGKKHRKPQQVHWAAVWNRWMSGKLPQLLSPNAALSPAHSSNTADDSASGNNHHSHGTHAVVVYGHFAKRGLDIREWTKGLDSGCQKGGKLTALVLDLESGVEKLESVDCSKKKKKKKKGKHGKGGHGGKKKGKSKGEDKE